MSSKKEYRECLLNSIALERTASYWSNLYTFLVFSSLVLSVLVLTEKLGVGMINWILGFLALIFTLLLQIFKERIEKIQGYRSLSNDFKILAREFSENLSNNAKNKLDTLTRKLAEYPVSERLKRKILKRKLK